eukprot:1138699-Pelagomonas_calceolata.AAC.3
MNLTSLFDRAGELLTTWGAPELHAIEFGPSISYPRIQGHAHARCLGCLPDQALLLLLLLLTIQQRVPTLAAAHHAHPKPPPQSSGPGPCTCSLPALPASPGTAAAAAAAAELERRPLQAKSVRPDRQREVTSAAPPPHPPFLPRTLPPMLPLRGLAASWQGPMQDSPNQAAVRATRPCCHPQRLTARGPHPPAPPTRPCSPRPPAPLPPSLPPAGIHPCHARAASTRTRAARPLQLMRHPMSPPPLSPKSDAGAAAEAAPQQHTGPIPPAHHLRLLTQAAGCP